MITLTQPGVDERRARADMRRQIARLEHEAAALSVAHRWGRDRMPTSAPDVARVQDLAALEITRDALLARIAALQAQAAEEAGNRALLRAMYADPSAHRWVQLRTDQLAERGCRTYTCVPRLGLIGLMGGWWRVKVSSGCPLACG